MLSLTVYIYPSSVYLAYYICLYTIRTVRSMLFLLLVFYFICRAPMPSRAVPVRSCLLIPMVHQFDPRSTSTFFLFRFPPSPPLTVGYFRFRSRSLILHHLLSLLILFRPFLVCLCLLLSTACCAPCFPLTRPSVRPLTRPSVRLLNEHYLMY